MLAYRLYRIDGAGKIQQAEWLQAVDDDAAIEAARATCNGDRYELWQRQRLVTRLAGSAAKDPDSSSSGTPKSGEGGDAAQ